MSPVLPRPVRVLVAAAALAVATGAEALAADPTWTGDVAVRRCVRTPRPFPDGVDDAMAAAVEITAGYLKGTGFLISPDGWVLTAAHVVRGFDSVDVRVGGRASTRATVIRVSTERDVALLYAGGQGLPCAPESMADAVTGSDLWVIGAPRGDEAFSVMRGVVSATRTIDGARLLQTDAAVNPGDSGGAMYDGAGRVRAIVSWKVSGTSYEGIGFGVPIGVALDALDVALGDRSEADPLSRAGARAGGIGGIVGTAPVDPAAAAAAKERFAAIAAERTRTKRRTAVGLTAGGVGGVVVGGAMYFGTLGRYLGARDLDDGADGAIDVAEWRTLQGVNATGIVVASAGAVVALVGGLRWKNLPKVAVLPTADGVQVVGVLP